MIFPNVREFSKAFGANFLGVSKICKGLYVFSRKNKKILRNPENFLENPKKFQNAPNALENSLKFRKNLNYL